VTGMEFVGVMPTVQGFIRCDAGSLWIVIIPKSKDRFMERPPMKQYNHEPIYVWPGVVRGRVLSWRTNRLCGKAAMANRWDVR
jgi:hypothetical protein